MLKRRLVTTLVILSLLVVLPAAAGFVLARHAPSDRLTRTSEFPIGAPIVYSEEGFSTCPSANAHDVRPAERGDYYYYTIINYLRVAEVLRDGRIIAIARDRTRLCVWPEDASLRKARLSERLIYRARFPQA